MTMNLSAATVAASAPLREKIKDITQQGMYSQAEIAKAINYAPSSLTNWLGGKYGAASLKIEAALIKWLRKTGEGGGGDDDFPTAFIETSATRKVVDAIAMAHEQGVITVCVGKPGVGKSMGLRAWEQQARREGLRFISICCNVTTKSDAAVIHKVGAAMRVSTTRATRVILDNICNALRGDGATVLVVDEGQHLGLKGLEALRALHDETGTGIALLGSEALYRTLVLGDKSHIELQQLQDRIHVLELLTVLPHGELQRFVSTWWGAAVDQEVVGRLKAHSMGFPRRLVRILTHARQMLRESERAGAKPVLNAQLIDDAAKLMFRKEAA